MPERALLKHTRNYFRRIDVSRHHTYYRTIHLLAFYLTCARAFNPLTAPDVEVTTPRDKRTAAGLGIHFMRKLMDRIEYRRLEDGNLLILKKTLGVTTIKREARSVSRVPSVPCATLLQSFHSSRNFARTYLTIYSNP
jgi:hypothetical protein